MHCASACNSCLTLEMNIKQYQKAYPESDAIMIPGSRIADLILTRGDKIPTNKPVIIAAKHSGLPERFAHLNLEILPAVPAGFF